ncbi:MAG: ATP-dependent zinc protease family protein [Aeromonas sp.]
MSKMRLGVTLMLALCGSAWAATAAAKSTNYGWIEKGLILPIKVAVKMKLDTGALSSSLDARSIVHFERNGQQWVRFMLMVNDMNSGKRVTHQFERRVERTVTVRGAGGIDTRPLVTMSICVGRKVFKEGFTLRDRSEMNYPVLLGRSLLDQLGPVDTRRTFTTEPRCR